MSPASVFDIVLAMAVLGAAGFACFGGPRIRAVVMFLVFGVLLAVVWARLDAPDIAMAEAILGAGVTGALMMAAVTAAARPPARSPRPGLLVSLAAGALAAMIAVVLSVVLVSVPVADGVDAQVQDHLAESGVEHPVTAVLLNFRSYDTLLEIAVLAVAVLAALGLWGDGHRLPGLNPRAPDPGPLGAMVRVLAPVLTLLLGWLLVAGSTRPGGAFQAGALLAGAVVLAYLAGLGSGDRVQRWLAPLLLGGLGSFLALAFATAGLGAGWLVLAEPWAGGVIIAVEAALAVSIGATLGVLFVCTQTTSMANGGGWR
ncbi:MAG TPA: hydrogenase subunit MbhD domain-containing protein [Beutenbergiaceae bacterium]|nr:hydrogenase subunit MbhD domain-containing protein [Beutenbergiaceae bacterium]